MKARSRRPYRLRARAESAEESQRRILTAAREVFSTRDYDHATLATVAAEAGVGLQSVLRKFGTKEGLFSAVEEQVREEVAEHRNQGPAGDLVAAVKNLVAHYESHGAMVLHILAQEPRVPLLKAAAASGRSFHREWVERVLGPSLPADLTGRDLRLAELVAITDVLVWKLLRLDAGLTAARTEAAILHLVRAVARGEHR